MKKEDFREQTGQGDRMLGWRAETGKGCLSEGMNWLAECGAGDPVPPAS
jgi:hypothetical protein